METENYESELEEQLQQQQVALSEIQEALQLDESSEELQEVLPCSLHGPHLTAPHPTVADQTRGVAMGNYRCSRSYLNLSPSWSRRCWR